MSHINTESTAKKLSWISAIFQKLDCQVCVYRLFLINLINSSSQKQYNFLAQELTS